MQRSIRTSLAALLCLTAPAGADVAVTANPTLLTLNASLADNVQALFIMGDTQAFSDDVQRADDLDKIATWICTNKAAFGFLGVVEVGDLTQQDADAEWTRLDTIWDRFDACAMPYFPALGNHDTNPVVQDVTTSSNATKWQANVRSRVTTKNWWNGGFTVTPPPVAVTDVQGRTFWNNVGPFSVMAGEWGAIFANDPAMPAFVNAGYVPVQREWHARHPRSGLLVAIDHFGPCFNGSCPNAAFSAANRTELGRSFNTVAHLGGHVNGIACNLGFGYFGTQTRLDGKAYLVGSVDHSCGTRAYDATPYSWNAILTLNRKTQKLCLRTLRVIDASATPATVLGTPDYDRVGTGYNSAETCIDNPGAAR